MPAPDSAAEPKPEPEAKPEPEPEPRLLRPTLRVTRFMVPVGTALVAMAAFVVGHATATDEPARPIVIAAPTPPAEPPPAPAPPGPEPDIEPAPAVAPEPAPPPAPPAQHCPPVHQESTPPSEWTMSEEHLGPFARCLTAIDLAFVKRVLPDHDVTEEPQPYFPDHHLFKVTRRGRPFLTIWPPSNDGPGLRIEIHTPEIATPWRVRVGDRVGTLAARHRDLACMYGALQGDENLWCKRVETGDGWRDTLLYTIDMRPLGTDRSLVREEIDTSRIAHLRIEAIRWQPAATAP